jgi:hypothetical protein
MSIARAPPKSMATIGTEKRMMKLMMIKRWKLWK